MARRLPIQTPGLWKAWGLALGVGAAVAAPAAAQETGPFRLLGDSLYNVQYGDAAWGDLDGDGDFDLAVAGSTSPDIEAFAPSFRLYLNVGDSSFVGMGGGIRYIARYRYPFNEFGPPLDTRPESPLIDVQHGDVAWADYDGDGDLDLLTNGRTIQQQVVMHLYENDGSAQRLTLAETLPGTTFGDVDWGDYDNDGDLDLAFTGLDEAGQPVSALYENRRGEGGGFDRREAGLAPLAYGGIAWGDYDADGDLDLAVSGIRFTPQQFVTRVYRNDGGAFTDIGASFAALAFADVAWGDYDADGDLDLAVSGGRLSPYLMHGSTRVYRNDGGAFTDTGADDVLVGYHGGVDWGDYDNDGRLDLIATGGATPFGTFELAVFRHDGTDRFSRTYTSSGLYFGTASWGDYDADGDLDGLAVGRTARGDFCPVSDNLGDGCVQSLRNEQAPPTAPPTTPDGLRAMREGEAVTFAWDPATDDHTPAPGLTYSLRVGTEPGASDVVSAMALPSGRRLLPGPGNAGHTLQRTVRNLPEGAYYWAVQALDGAGAGSPFSEELIFTTGDPNDRTPPAPPSGLAARSGDGRVTLTWNANAEEDLARYRLYRGTAPGEGTRIASLTAGTTTRYVDTRVENGVVYYYRLTAVDISGNESTFSEEAVGTPRQLFEPVDAGLPPASMATAAWADYDGDGDLDLLMAGVAGTAFFRLLRNDDGTFAEVDFPFLAPFDGAIAWGDYDGDGDPDIAVSGTGFQTQNLRILRNDGAGFSAAFAMPAGEGRIEWGDYDGDGDLDVRQGHMVYRNDDGAFTPADFDLPEPVQGDGAWADYDGDGDLDLALGGWRGTELFVELYRFDDGRYVPDRILRSVLNPAFAWGDFDADGDPDLVVTGTNALGTAPVLRYDNRLSDGGAFVQEEFFDQSISDPEVRLVPGDYDNDGDLDLAFNLPDVTLIAANQGGRLAEIARLALNGGSPVVPGDYDGDFDLDLVLFAPGQSRLYVNNFRPGNTPPSAPAGLAAAVDGAAVVLRWDMAADAQTPTPGLTYNLRVGTTPGAADVVSPLAHDDGSRRVAAPGNAGPGTAHRLRDLAPGTYFWSVQAVDAAYAASAFSPEQVFTIGSGGTSRR